MMTAQVLFYVFSKKTRMLMPSRFLTDALDLASRSLNVISRLEVDIRSIGIEFPETCSGAYGFVSIKSFVSLKLTQWSV